MRNGLIWEQIYASEYRTHISMQFYRAKVFGGWLIHSITIDDKTPISESMSFVPDDNHVWQIEDIK